MTVADAQLRQITGDIWTTMLGLDLQPGEPEATRAPGSEPVIQGCIQITGDWEGAVTLDFPARLARRAGAIMFGTAPEDVADEDLRDVVGELTNMAGGNVKALVGGSCRLSLPAVTEGADYLVSLPGSRVVNRVTFDCGGDLLLVTVLERAAGT